MDHASRLVGTYRLLSFENFAVVARREEELRHELVHRPDVVLDVPTFAELGFPDVIGLGYFGLVAPGGTPKAPSFEDSLMMRLTPSIFDSPPT
mgnify:CR=1 FL=1